MPATMLRDELAGAHKTAPQRQNRVSERYSQQNEMLGYALF